MKTVDFSETTRGGQVMFEQTVGSICIEVEIKERLRFVSMTDVQRLKANIIVNKCYNRL